MISVLVACQRGAVVALHALLALRPSDSRQHTHVYYLSTCVVSPLYRSFAMMNDMHLGLASVRPSAQRRVARRHGSLGCQGCVDASKAAAAWLPDAWLGRLGSRRHGHVVNATTERCHASTLRSAARCSLHARSSTQCNDHQRRGGGSEKRPPMRWCVNVKSDVVTHVCWRRVARVRRWCQHA